MDSIGEKLAPRMLKMGLDARRIISYTALVVAGSSNGRTAGSGSVCEGSTPSPAAISSRVGLEA